MKREKSIKEERRNERMGSRNQEKNTVAIKKQLVIKLKRNI